MMPRLATAPLTKSCSVSETLLSIENTTIKSGHKFRVQTDHSALQHMLNQPWLTGRQMRLLETLQEYDFDIEYYSGARNYIRDALSRWPDHKTPPIPQMRSTSDRATDCVSNCTTISTDLLLARGNQADDWMAQLRQE